MLFIDNTFEFSAMLSACNLVLIGVSCYHGNVHHFNQAVLFTSPVKDFNALASILNFFVVFHHCGFEVEPVPALNGSLCEDVQRQERNRLVVHDNSDTSLDTYAGRQDH